MTTDPFVMLFQPAIAEFGNLTTAALFGLIWRRAQNGQGRCTASHNHLADTLGVNLRTIQREAGKLVKGGYIEDHKPDARQRMTTHEYSITSRGLTLVPEQISDKTSLNNEESNQIPEENKRQNVVTTRQKVAKNPDKRQSDATKRQNVIQRYKEEIKEEDKREERVAPPQTKTAQHRVATTSPSPSQPRPNGQEPKTSLTPWGKPSARPDRQGEVALSDYADQVDQLADAIADLCKIDRTIASDGKLKTIKSGTVKLLAKHVTAKDVKEFGRWWRSFDWRGQKGSPPTPDQICDEWERFRGAKLNGSPTSKLSDEQMTAARQLAAEEAAQRKKSDEMLQGWASE